MKLFVASFGRVLAVLPLLLAAVTTLRAQQTNSVGVISHAYYRLNVAYVLTLPQQSSTFFGGNGGLGI